MSVLWYCLAGGLLLALYLVYVSLIKKKNNLKEAAAGIDVQLKKRYDLIPNLLKSAAKFMEHERDVFMKVTELREKAMSADSYADKFKADNMLSEAMKQFKLTAENYPELKSDATMIAAMQGMSDVEEHIAASRRFYNSAVKDYKNAFNASSEYKKLKDSKDYKDSQDKQELEGKAFLDFTLKIEKDKLLYFSLSLNKEVLVIKAPSDNKEQKRFLGYEWSNRKGDEGLKELNKPYLSPLFERDNPTNPNKLNFLVREAFNHTLESIPKELEPYAFRARLVDMLDFEKVEFNKAISLNPRTKRQEIKSKYPLVRLETCGDFFMGGTPSRKNPNYWNGNIKWLTIGDYSNHQTITDTKEKITQQGFNESNAKMIQKGAVVVSIYATIGRVGILGEDMTTNQAIVSIIPNDNFINKYLMYVIDYYKFQLLDETITTSQKNINLTILQNMLIPKPPIEIQKQIVKECEKVEKQSSTIKTSIEKYQELIKAILAKCAITESSADNASIQEILTQLNTLESSLDFDLLFECLESTNADSQKDISGYALNIAESALIDSSFASQTQNDTMESYSEYSRHSEALAEESKNLDSSNTKSKAESTLLKPLNLKALLDSLPTPPPQGWERVRLGEVCEILIGGTPPRNNQSYFNGNHLWVSIAEMQGKIITNTKEKINDEGIKKSNVKLIPKGSVLLSFKLSIGKTAIAGKDLYTNEAIAGLIPKNKENIKDNYLFFIFKYKSINLNLKDNNAFGKSLNSDILKNDVQIPLPPIESQKQIINVISKIEEKISLMDSSLESLEDKKSKILKSALEST